MLKPKALITLLEQALKSFTSLKNIFISNPDGTLLASALTSEQDITYIASFTNIWIDYSEVGKANSVPDEQNQVNLNFTLLDFDKGKGALTLILNSWILGAYTDNKQEIEVGVLLAEIKLLKEVLEKHFQGIVEQQENPEELKINNK